MGFWDWANDRQTIRIAIRIPATQASQTLWRYPNEFFHEVSCTITVPTWVSDTDLKELMDKVYNDLIQIAKERKWDYEFARSSGSEGSGVPGEPVTAQ